MICKNKHIQIRGQFCRKCGTPVSHLFTKARFKSVIGWTLSFLIPLFVLYLFVAGVSCINEQMQAMGEATEKAEMEFKKSNPQEWVSLIDQTRKLEWSSSKEEVIRSFASSHKNKDCTSAVLRKLMSDAVNDEYRVKIYDIAIPLMEKPLSPDEKTKILSILEWETEKSKLMKKMYE